MKKIIILSLAFAFLFVGVAPQANAQTSGAPIFSSREEHIAYLQGVLAQLIAQYTAVYDGTSQSIYTYTTTQTAPRSQVLGAVYSTVSVRTGYVNYGDGEADLHGEVDIKNASHAYVWFEYGNDRDFDDNSSKKKMTRDGSFSVELDDFEEDEYFYYRAAAEDPQGRVVRGEERAFYVGKYDSRRSNNGDDEPEAKTEDAEDVRDDEAELHGEIDMNDFNNGLVFFVYGEDEDQVDEAADEDEYRDIDEDGDDLQKVIVDSDLDNDRSFYRTVTGLDDNTDHYFRICVEFEDEDDDQKLECGKVEEFETD